MMLGLRLVKAMSVSCDFSFIIPFSREWAVDLWFDHLKTIEWDWSRTKIIVMVDFPTASLAEKIKSRLSEVDSPKKVVKWLQNPSLPERYRIPSRRRRVVQVWQSALQYFEGEYLMGCEDDTLMQPDGYKKLLQVMLEFPSVGYAQGSEIGRWAVPFIPHWTEESPFRWTSGVYERDPVVQIDGGGLYGFIARMAALGVGPRLEPSTPMGPDVRWVKDIKELGYTAIGRWDVSCIHLLNQQEALIPGITPIKQLIWEYKDGGWDYRSKPAISGPCTMEWRP